MLFLTTKKQSTLLAQVMTALITINGGRDDNNKLVFFNTYSNYNSIMDIHFHKR